MDRTIIILLIACICCVCISISIGGGIALSTPTKKAEAEPEEEETTTISVPTTTMAPTTTAAPTTTTTTTTKAPTTTPYTGCWNCYLISNKTRQDSWNDAGNGGGLCGYSQNDASNTCNAWISNCGNMGGCTAYKVGQTPS